MNAFGMYEFWLEYTLREDVYAFVFNLWQNKFCECHCKNWIHFEIYIIKYNDINRYTLTLFFSSKVHDLNLNQAWNCVLFVWHAFVIYFFLCFFLHEFSRGLRKDSKVPLTQKHTCMMPKTFNWISCMFTLTIAHIHAHSLLLSMFVYYC